MERNFKALKDRAVSSVLIQGKDQVRFVTDQGELQYFADGDCCSVSWIEHISNLDQLLGQKVLRVEEVELPDPQGEDLSKYDCLQLYGVKLHTEKGYCLIEFRNDSNGYYGGSMEQSTVGGDGFEVLQEDL